MINNLKLCRIKSGFTQGKAADMLGTTVQTYNRWEKNPGIIQMTNAIKLAELYGVTLDYLFLSNT